MSDPNLSVKITADSAQFTQSVKKAASDFKAAAQSMGESAAQTKARVDSAFSSLGIRSLGEVRAEAARVRESFTQISAEAGKTSAETVRAFEAAKAKLAELNAEAAGLGKSGAAISGLGTSAGGLGAAFGAVVGPLLGAVAGMAALKAAAEGAKAVFDSGLGLERLRTQLSFATNGNTAAAFNYIKSTANSLGLEINTTAQGFAKFASAARGTKLEGDGVKSVFTGVSNAAAVMKLSTEEVNGVFLALTQMMSKGTVSAEELRGQLAERLPGAFGLAAQAIGVTEQQLGKMLEKGEVISSDFLPKFGKVLNETFGGAAASAANSAGANLNRIGNAWEEFKQAIADAGFFDAVSKGLSDFVEWINKAKASGELALMAREISDSFTGLLEVIQRVGRAFLWLKELGGPSAQNMLFVASAQAVKEALTSAKSEADTFKTALTGLAQVDFSKPFTDGAGRISGELTKLTKDVDRYADATKTAAKITAESFQQSAATRAATLGKMANELEKTEKDITEKHKKAAEERELVDTKLAASKAERETRAALAKAALYSKGDADEIRRAEQVVKSESVIRDAAEKRLATQAAAAKKAEAIEKAALENQKRALAEASTAMVTETARGLAERLTLMSTYSAQITAAVVTAAKERGRLEVQANREALTEIAALGAASVAKRAEAGAAALTTESAGYAARLSARSGFVGRVREMLGIEDGAERAHGNTVRDIIRAAADAMISEKNRQYDTIKGRLDQYVRELSEHAGNIKRLEDQLKEAGKFFDNAEFEIKLIGAKDGERAVMILGEAEKKMRELEAARADASAKGTLADEATIKNLDALSKEVVSLAKDYASTGKESVGTAAAQATALDLVRRAKEQVTAAYRDGKSSEEIALESTQKKITDTREELTGLVQEMAKLADLKDVAVNIDIKNPEKVAELLAAFASVKAAAENDLLVKMQAVPEPFREGVDAALAEASAKTSTSVHNVAPDTAVAEAAIDRLKQNTSSHHTVYVQEVQQRAAGGAVFARRNGAIFGAGTGTSDSIPTMLSNGEFVLRAAAVKRLGLGMLNAMNSGGVPALPVRRFATGGLVSAGSGSRDSVDLNFSVGGGSFKLQSSREMAKGLASALRELSRGK